MPLDLSIESQLKRILRKDRAQEKDFVDEFLNEKDIRPHKLMRTVLWQWTNIRMFILP